jgi:hypothetical protein
MSYSRRVGLSLHITVSTPGLLTVHTKTNGYEKNKTKNNHSVSDHMPICVKQTNQNALHTSQIILWCLT